MNAKTVSVVLAVVIVAGIGLAGEDEPKIKVLVVTGGHGFNKKPFFKIFEDNAQITFTAASQGKSSQAYDRDDLLSYDVVVLYDMVQKITDAQKRNFLSLFDKGTGLVALHHCMGSYQNWPEFEKIIGGKYFLKAEKRGDKTWPASGYKHGLDLKMRILLKEHPITAGIDDFTIHDETYCRYRVCPDVTPLLTTDHPTSEPVVAWCKTYRKSRVAYLQGGHDQHAYNNPNYRRLIAQAIRWAARR